MRHNTKNTSSTCGNLTMPQPNRIHSTASLHIIGQPPSQWANLAAQMKPLVKTGDAIVLLGDASDALGVITQTDATSSQLLQHTLSQFFAAFADAENRSDVTLIKPYVLSLADNAIDDRVICNVNDLNQVGDLNESSTNAQDDHLAFQVISHHALLHLSHTYHSVIRW